MGTETTVSFLGAFGAGLLMFLSPCILPLIPTYISYLAGISFKEMKGELSPEDKIKIRLKTLGHSISFVIGFSVIFVLLGTTVTFLGQLFIEHQLILKRISAVLIILFGLMITGFLKIDFLARERRIEYKKKDISYLGSILVGMTFAFAWTPCIGPILGSILVYASSTASMRSGIVLLSIFSMGMAVPFILSSLLINSFLSYFDKIKKYVRIVNIVGGLILIGFGVLILTGGIR